MTMPEAPGHGQTIVVDFDGVLHQYAGWNGNRADGDAVDGAPMALKRLAGAGWRVVVHSARGETWVRQWLKERRLDDVVDAVVARKPPAAAYFDDRAVHVPSNSSGALAEAFRAWECGYASALEWRAASVISALMRDVVADQAKQSPAGLKAVQAAKWWLEESEKVASRRLADRDP